MDELFDKMCIRAAERIQQIVTAKFETAFEKYLRSSVKLVYTEQQAAKFLGVSVETLAAWRKRGLITYARLPLGRLAKEQEDGLGPTCCYDVDDLMRFVSRYKVRTESDRSKTMHLIADLGPEFRKNVARIVG